MLAIAQAMAPVVADDRDVGIVFVSQGNSNESAMALDASCWADAPPEATVSCLTPIPEHQGNASVVMSTTSGLPLAEGEWARADVATMDITATAGEDYVANSATLEIQPGNSRSDPFVVQITDDTAVEESETFVNVITGFDASSGVSLRNDHFVHTILDNDSPTQTIALSASRSSISEDGGDVEIEVTATVGGMVFSTSTPVTVSVAGSGEEAAVDFAPVSSFTINIAASARSGSATFTVMPVDDEVLEFDEVIHVTGEAAGLTVEGTEVRLLDDDSDLVFDIDPASDTEGAGHLAFPVSISREAAMTAEVYYATLDISASSEGDYEEASGWLAFSPGETDRSIRVTVVDDTTYEREERLGLLVVAWIIGGSGGYFRPGFGAIGTIFDDDDPPLAQVAAAEVAEGGSLRFEVKLQGKSAVPAELEYSTSDGSASAGDDYQAASGKLYFEPGVDTQEIAVSTLDDNVVEGDETLVLTLTSATEAKLDPSATTAPGTIRDNDTASLSTRDATAVESAGEITFRLTLSAVNTQPVMVNYATADGSATEGEDYTAATGTVTFAAGQTVATVRIALLDDDRAEPDETFRLELSGAMNAALGRASAEGRIEDDDDRAVLIEPDTLAVAEGNTSSYRIALASEPSGPVTVAATGTEGTDVSLSPPEVTLGPTDWQTGQRISVAAAEDDDAVTDDPVSVRHQVNGADYDGVPASDVTVSIIENDEAAFFVNDVSAGESDGSLRFTVSLSAGDEAASADFATSDGTAVAGQDYGNTSGRLEFAPGESQKTVEVPILDDAANEPDETFTLTLSNPSGAVVSAGAATATGTIVDDDAAPGLSVSGASAAEGAGALEFAVRLGAASGVPVTVDYATSDGTAVAGQDYENTTGQLTFAVGELAKTVRVPILDDTLKEPDETFTLVLSNPSGATISVGEAPGTIVDDDAVSALRVSNATGTEDADTLAFAVRLVAAASTAVGVEYATSDGTAVAGEDYGHTSGRLEFAPGELGKTVRVPILDDALEEPDETFVLRLSNPSGAVLAVGTATGTIVDDDAPLQVFRVLLFEAAAHPSRQGFLRVINHSARGGEVEIEAVDDGGMRRNPIRLSIDAAQATHFNSNDLEDGNAEKGLSGGVGPSSQGDWHLTLTSDLDIEVLTFARTKRDGFVTTLHDSVPVASGVHRVSFFNPGRNTNQQSLLRLVNTGDGDVQATVSGVDDEGVESGEVQIGIPARRALTLSAEELESGVAGGIAAGALGTGTGKWRLTVSSPLPLGVKSLLTSPPGYLANLSTSPRTPGSDEDTHGVPWFPSLSDAAHSGVVRVINHSAQAAEVRIVARDDSGREYGPVMLAVDAAKAVHFNSADLELGNPARGLTGSTGAGTGSWRLDLSSARDIEVLSYVRSHDEFLTPMHDLAPVVDGTHRVAFFNPASNERQVSRLRLVNQGALDATVRLTGVDDSGRTPGTPVRLRVMGGRALEVAAAELESGTGPGIETGALGDGEGKWRLRLESDRPIQVMSLLDSPSGHVTNLSSTLILDGSP